MGAEFTKFLLPHHWKEDEPASFAPIKYNPEFGFEAQPRSMIVPKATEAEMRSANIEPVNRDECAHLRIAYRGCVAYNSPLVWRCKGLFQELEHCYYELRIHDMKEFEREKRLNARERRLAATAAS